MPDGLITELEQQPRSAERKQVPAAGVLPRRDMRARRPVGPQAVVRSDAVRGLMRVVTLGVLDVTGLVLGIWTAVHLKAVVKPGTAHASITFNEAIDLAPLACLVMLLLFARSGLYRHRELRPGTANVAASLVQVMVVVLAYALIEGERFSSYYVFYGSLFFALIFVSLFRGVFENVAGRVLRAAGFGRRAVLVGSGTHIEAVAHALKDGSQEIDPVGFVSLTPRPENGLRDFGPLERLERHFDDIDEIVIADPDFPQNEAVELVDRCHQHGIRVRVAPSTMEILMDRVEFVPGQSLPLFELKPPVFEGFDFVVKRSFDLIVAALLLVTLAPLMLVIAALVRFTSRGPVIYRSQRPGIGGQPFACFKFRTMHQDAEKYQSVMEQIYEDELNGPMFKLKDDPRVTGVGSFLRRWSLDELPQLLNVVRGQMSLVGPRPLPQHDYNRLEDWHRKRYLVLPGMTGLWQVSGRSELDFDELVRLDFLYLESWSVFLDLSILLKTVPAVLKNHGAW